MLLVQPQNVPAVDLWLADVPTPRARFDDFTHSRWRRAKGWKERSIADEALILLGVAYIREATQLLVRERLTMLEVT
uniref:Uncharacterized protein n=1 Tax=Hyaloperonospora arabidopsidis (strain Emoy2) TaxID=559515 RepID=M4BHW4_HYAAE